MTTEVIVYRSPMEKAMYDMFMDGTYFPIFVGIIVFFLLVLMSIRIVDKYKRRNTLVRKWETWLVFIPSTSLSLFVIYVMCI